jgi:nitrate/TMAO reductase-like tetraheme cytochrome c subunit
MNTSSTITRYFLQFSLAVYGLTSCLCTIALAQPIGIPAHEQLKKEKKYPSAQDCGTCHPQHYKEWSGSPHAYAQLSPVFNAMQATLLKQTNGTLGDFCIRCHTPIGMDDGEPLVTPNARRSPISQEGVTCIACHRREFPYGKTSGRFKFSPGDIFEAVHGPSGGDEVRRVIESGEFDVNAVRGKPGRAIHAEAKKNDQMSTSAFCGTCHDVYSPTGFRLEEAFSEFKHSPAATEGFSCQDCHMGKTAGIPSGYEERSVAIVGGKPTKKRKHANHRFTGPDYSIVHPGIFPHNPEAKEFASFAEWLSFDYEAGWGTDDFEDTIDENFEFPERWEDIADRFEARELIEVNQEHLEELAERRKALLQIGYQLGDVDIENADPKSIAFRVEVKNGTSGHNVPTGFDAERVVFLRVTVKDSTDRTVFISGDLDPNGDVRDSHSLYVHNGELEEDRFLFSLQSRFIANMIRGGDREQVLTTNYSLSPLPFIRPPANATLLQGRPAGGRKHRQTIPPLASRWASYRIDSSALANSSGPYTATIELIAGMVPVNLIDAIKDVGFDYGMSARAVADKIVQGHQTLWTKTVTIDVSMSSDKGGE